MSADWFSIFRRQHPSSCHRSQRATPPGNTNGKKKKEKKKKKKKRAKRCARRRCPMSAAGEHGRQISGWSDRKAIATPASLLPQRTLTRVDAPSRSGLRNRPAGILPSEHSVTSAAERQFANTKVGQSWRMERRDSGIHISPLSQRRQLLRSLGQALRSNCPRRRNFIGPPVPDSRVTSPPAFDMLPCAAQVRSNRTFATSTHVRRSEPSLPFLDSTAEK